MTDVLARSRSDMLDALEALGPHRASIIVIGAHAIYLREPSRSVALAPVTRDSDLAIDPRNLASAPRLEAAMRRAGFTQDAGAAQPQPGIWLRRVGDELDEVGLMVTEKFAGAGRTTTAAGTSRCDAPRPTRAAMT